MPVTMAEIALRCGLSQPAVSQALNGKGRLPEETRQRVMKVATEMGYRPSLSARATRTGRLGCVALLQSSVGWRSILPPHLLDGIHDGLAERQQHLVVVKLADEELEREGWQPRLLLERMADGLIINFTCEIPPGIQRLIATHGVPAVWMNALRDGDCVRPDDVGAAREATERLIALGHQRIAFVDYAHGVDASGAHYSVQHRRDGYAAAMKAAGLKPRFEIDELAVPLEDRIRRTRAWLAGSDRPTAAVAYGTAVAMPVLLAAREAGLTLPRDLSIISFADHDPASMGVALDAMLVPEYELGRAAVDMLFAAMNGTANRKAKPTLIVPCAYKPAGSAQAPA